MLTCWEPNIKKSPPDLICATSAQESNNANALFLLDGPHGLHFGRRVERVARLLHEELQLLGDIAPGDVDASDRVGEREAWAGRIKTQMTAEVRKVDRFEELYRSEHTRGFSWFPEPC